MSEIKTPLKDRVPVGQKAAFGAGHFVLNLLPGVLGVYLQVFILTAFGMDPIWAGLLGGLPRIFDALTDPIMGFISDNTKSRYGRRRPYIFSGAIISGILFILMWQLDENASMTYNFWYVMILQILFLVGNTMFATPLVGLGYEMTPDYNERTRLMSLANSMGQIAWIIVPWLYVIIPDPNTFDNPAQGVRTMAYIVGGVCMVFGILPALFCKGMDAGEMEDRERISLKTLAKNMKKLYEGIVQVSKNKPFMKLCGATFLVFNGFQLVAAFSVFIIVFYMYQGSWEMAGTWPAWFNSLNAVITALIVIPIVSKMATRFGKRKAFLIATFLSIIGYILKWWGFDVELNEQFNQTALGESLTEALGSLFNFLNPYLESIGATWFTINVEDGVPWLIFLPIPFFAFGMGGLFTLMMSMTADVCDLDELENGLPRKEGTFGAIYWWMVKVGQALAIILSGVILKIVGFDQNITDQSLETMTNLRIADILVPASTAALAFLVMWRYDLGEKRVREIAAELKKRKALPKRTSSSYHAQNLLSLTSLQIAPDFKYDIDFSDKSIDEVLHLFSTTLNKGMHGLCFSPYEEGQDIEDVLSEEQIIRRVDIVKPYTNWLRSFSSTGGNEYIPQVARRSGIKTMAGAWISEDKAQNQIEIEELIKLGKAGHVDIAVVGNEVLLREELTEEELLVYIETVKKALPGIPVGYVDAYSLFNESSSLIEACDVILINCYPFWEGAEIEIATSYLREMYSLVKAKAKDKPVMIAETGWPTQGENTGKAIPTRLNAMKYFINVNNWAQKENIDLFYFSSFDESWKARHEGDVGQRWGIWDKNEKIKFK
ncbi:MFS transporter [Psychroflexus sediminis]|uniref:Endo-1,3-beta-glucanase btgC n=1 Tax=Psychroflexus sediminis TaxID=470826 RepID=A0A1G7TSK8_9FLAO|nr:MFS transporter [Psychroflexus sediminis]SDG38293.1 Na+/melibiose symporter [Psychroflexus sediminis]